MNTKEQCLDSLGTILQEHKNRLLALEILVRTNDPDAPNVVKDYSECSFVKWTKNAELIKHRIGLQLFEKLDRIHKQWHATYDKVIDIFYPKKSSLFSKLLHKKPSELELNKAQSYVDDLNQLQKELSNTIEGIQRRVRALSESKFHQ